MTVTDEHIAVLRSFLVDDYQVWYQRTEQLLASGNAENYGLLIHAAFTRAAYRKFSPSWSLPDVIQFVGKVRSNLGSNAHSIDAVAAEKLLRQSIGDESLSPKELASLDIETVAVVEGFLLQVMVREFNLDEAGLEEFINDAALHANKWLAARVSESSPESDSTLDAGHQTNTAASMRRHVDRGPAREADGAWEAS